VPSVECTLKQLKEFGRRGRLAPLVFFYPALMTSKAYAKSDCRGEHILIDRKGFKYKVLFDEDRIVRIYNPVPVDMLFELEKFSEFEAIALDFAATERAEALQALGYLAEKIAGKNPQKKFAKFTRGHYDNEVP
jgi:hypothetical protein